MHTKTYNGGFRSNEISAHKLGNFTTESFAGGIARDAMRGSVHFNTFVSNGLVTGYLDPQGFEHNPLRLFQAQCIDNNPKYRGLLITDCSCEFANCPSDKLSTGAIIGITVGSVLGGSAIIGGIVFAVCFA